MTNPVKGEALLKLVDGRVFTIVLDFEALIEAEQAYGKPLQMTMTEAAMGYVGALRAMLYGALRTHHPSISLREAGEMIRADMDSVTTAIEAAVDAALPRTDASDKSEGKDGKNPLGKNSGPSGAKSGLNPKPSGVPHLAPSS